jgi:hypothetical protein
LLELSLEESINYSMFHIKGKIHPPTICIRIVFGEKDFVGYDFKAGFNGEELSLTV